MELTTRTCCISWTSTILTRYSMHSRPLEARGGMKIRHEVGDFVPLELALAVHLKLAGWKHAVQGRYYDAQTECHNGLPIFLKVWSIVGALLTSTSVPPLKGVLQKQLYISYLWETSLPSFQSLTSFWAIRTFGTSSTMSYTGVVTRGSNHPSFRFVCTFTINSCVLVEHCLAMSKNLRAQEQSIGFVFTRDE